MPLWNLEYVETMIEKEKRTMESQHIGARKNMEATKLIDPILSEYDIESLSTQMKEVIQQEIVPLCHHY